MKLIKTIVLGLFITLSSLGISSVAYAEPAQSIDNVSAKITEASKAIENGSSSNEAAELVGEIQLSDNIVSKRQRANAVLKKARLVAKKARGLL